MNTKITYEQVQKAAEDVKTNASTMNGIFDKFTSIMNELVAADVFAGIASDTLTDKFAKIKTRLNTYVAKVEEFSGKISKAGDTTEETERKIQQQAAEIPDINF